MATMHSDTASLDPYRDLVHDRDDLPLFDEAAKAAGSGALRAAYIMIWLSCAESLKRRFYLASQRDHSVGKIVGEIERLERNNSGTDKYILDHANRYGLLSQTGYSTLYHVYQKRCLYAHPYEYAPRPEQVYSAAAEVVEHVLSCPVKLGKGFASTVVKNLSEDRAFLDDREHAVRRYASDISSRLSADVLPWMLEKYWQTLQAGADDPSMAPLLRRGTWFSRQLLREWGTQIFDEHQWHTRAQESPDVLLDIFQETELFDNLHEFPKSYVVNSALEGSKNDPIYLKKLEPIYLEGILSREQKSNFDTLIDNTPIETLAEANLDIASCYGRVIRAFASHNWYVQNPAMDWVVGSGAESIYRLGEDERIVLGRNVLQAAEGRARSVQSFLRKLPEDDSGWPTEFICGITIECFVNENGTIRPKTQHLEDVIKVLEATGEDDAEWVVGYVRCAIESGTFHPNLALDEKEEFKEVLRGNRTIRPIQKAIREKLKHN